MNKYEKQFHGLLLRNFWYLSDLLTLLVASISSITSVSSSFSTSTSLSSSSSSATLLMIFTASLSGIVISILGRPRSSSLDTPEVTQGIRRDEVIAARNEAATRPPLTPARMSCLSSICSEDVGNELDSVASRSS